MTSAATCGGVELLVVAMRLGQQTAFPAAWPVRLLRTVSVVVIDQAQQEQIVVRSGQHDAAPGANLREAADGSAGAER